MREILFRGKRVDNGEWETGSLVIIRGGCSDEQVFITDKMTGYLTPVIPETAGQFVGTVDKNGKKICEGDIVKFGNNAYEIRFIEKYSRFAGTNAHCVFASFLLKNSEIIGNVHDNPELMDDSTADEDELAEEGD